MSTPNYFSVGNTGSVGMSVGPSGGVPLTSAVLKQLSPFGGGGGGGGAPSAVSWDRGAASTALSGRPVPGVGATSGALSKSLQTGGNSEIASIRAQFAEQRRRLQEAMGANGTAGSGKGFEALRALASDEANAIAAAQSRVNTQSLSLARQDEQTAYNRGQASADRAESARRFDLSLASRTPSVTLGGGKNPGIYDYVSGAVGGAGRGGRSSPGGAAGGGGGVYDFGSLGGDTATPRRGSAGSYTDIMGRTVYAGNRTDGMSDVPMIGGMTRNDWMTAGGLRSQPVGVDAAQRATASRRTSQDDWADAFTVAPPSAYGFDMPSIGRMDASNYSGDGFGDLYA